MHAAEYDGPIDLAEDMLCVHPRGRALGKAGQDAHLLFATFLSLGYLLPRLRERIMQKRVRVGEHSSHESIHSTVSPPDLITGWRGSMPFLTATGPSTRCGPRCSMIEDGYQRQNGDA